MEQLVVVFVDDDGPLQEIVVCFLRKKGFIVHAFSDFGSALVALEMLKKVDVLITDFRYCRGLLNGVEFIEQGLEIKEDIGALVLISSMVEAGENAERSPAQINFLPKPNIVNLYSAQKFAENLVIFVNGLQRN